jgi:hypothetical protein
MVEADSPDQAVNLFMEAQREACARRRINGDQLQARIAIWESEGGLASIDVEEPAPGSAVDWPEPDLPATPPRTTPFTVGHVGKRPGQEERVPTPNYTAPQRESLREYGERLKREVFLGLVTEGEQQTTEAMRLEKLAAQQAQQAAEQAALAVEQAHQPAGKKVKKTASTGPVLGVPDDDDVPTGPFLERIPK